MTHPRIIGEALAFIAVVFIAAAFTEVAWLLEWRSALVRPRLVLLPSVLLLPVLMGRVITHPVITGPRPRVDTIPIHLATKA
jgi:hypothetical protein